MPREIFINSYVSWRKKKSSQMSNFAIVIFFVVVATSVPPSQAMSTVVSTLQFTTWETSWSFSLESLGVYYKKLTLLSINHMLRTNADDARIVREEFQAIISQGREFEAISARKNGTGEIPCTSILDEVPRLDSTAEEKYDQCLSERIQNVTSYQADLLSFENQTCAKLDNYRRSFEYCNTNVDGFFSSIRSFICTTWVGLKTLFVLPFVSHGRSTHASKVELLKNELLTFDDSLLSCLKNNMDPKYLTGLTFDSSEKCYVEKQTIIEKIVDYIETDMSCMNAS